MSMGCSCFTWESEDGKLHFQGRTYDTVPQPDMALVFCPRNMEFHLLADPASPSVKLPYAMMGMGMGPGMLSQPLLFDGVNEYGLMGANLLYPGFATYTPMEKAGPKAVYPGFYVAYILGQCRDLDELIALAKESQLVDEVIQGRHATCHYIFSDKTGRSVVLEPDPEGLTIYDHAHGVLTNSPSYSWHLTNLRNYLVQTRTNPEPKTLDGEVLKKFGSGGGTWGVPGDFSPPSRFVRLSFAREYLVKGKDELTSVMAMMNGFSVVNVPEGMVEEAPGWYDISLYTSVFCAESLTYYYKTYKTQRVNALKMAPLLDTSEIKVYPIIHTPSVNYLD
ncbi:MAG: linear amide C-N hydrolase [Eubacteriaceae bacterium]